MALRPMRLDDDQRRVILAAIRAGATYHHAAQAAGVSSNTFHDWLSKGRAERERLDEGREPDEQQAQYVALLTDVESAGAQGVIVHLGHINTAARGTALRGPQWRASAWLLERRHPDDFGRRVEVSGPGGLPILDPTGARQVIEARLAEMADRLATPEPPPELAAGA